MGGAQNSDLIVHRGGIGIDRSANSMCSNCWGMLGLKMIKLELIQTFFAFFCVALRPRGGPSCYVTEIEIEMHFVRVANCKR